MRKVIAAFNMTLDGFCDHTIMVADEELHRHYSDLMKSGGAILYGRKTYQLMEFWPTILKNPTGDKAMDEFAVAIENIPKIVFSNTLQTLEWKTATLAKKDIKEEILELRQRPGKDIFVGSRSLIITLLNLHLIDELQLCVQPIIARKGLPFFENLNERIDLKLLKTKLLKGTGSMIFYYQPTENISL
jgi:dihydrofolate reductase